MDFISKANNFLTNNKPRLKSNTRQSGYETDLRPQIQTPINLTNSPIRL